MTQSAEEIAVATTVVRQYCDAWVAGDAMAVLGFYHSDMTLEWPGRHRLAGVHRGLDASLEALLDLQAATNRVPHEIVGVVAVHETVLVVVVERWSSSDGARSIDLKRILEFTISDGKLRMCRIFESDQPAVDEWIDRAQ